MTMTPTSGSVSHRANHTPMGLNMPSGKLCLWIFLVTEVMFFTGLLGAYLILRSGIPHHPVIRWPTPEQVHLSPTLGALNTLVLILSSLTVVLALRAAQRGGWRAATWLTGLTLLLGCVFLGIKGIEYKTKWDHDILPGRIGELLPGMGWPRERDLHAIGMQYVGRVRRQLESLLATPGPLSSDTIQALRQLLADMKDGEAGPSYRSPLTPAQVGQRVNALLHQAEEKGEYLALSPAIPFGNLWASCYFGLTGFHALHVLAGLVAFAWLFVCGLRGGFGPETSGQLELTALYWHFVELVWIVLFPVLYLL
jgi:cytochrome c oxidase subunit 3